MSNAHGQSDSALADRIRSILTARGLSLAEVSRSSRSLAKSNPLHHIPHNFYSAFRNREFRPSIYQVLALSVLSGYQLVDWLRVFGFSLDDVRRFQASFPALRTVELDARIYHAGALLPWFDDLEPQDLSAPLVPLSRWLTARPQRFGSHSRAASAAFRYFKIGSQDAYAFPELLPGSIVRVNRNVDALERVPLGQSSAKSIFLIEHNRGMICSRLSRPEPRKIVLCSGHLPYAPVELEQGRAALVSGVVDLEIRPLSNFETPIVPAELGRFWLPGPLAAPRQARTVGEFISRARRLSGLSFRDASARTKLISGQLGDSRYYCAAGSLSDYETRRVSPRQIHKLISICATYFASATDILEASGAGFEKGGELAMLPEFLGLPNCDVHASARPSHFLGELERLFGELPYFLESSLASLFRLPDISVRDVFWVGGSEGFIHPHLSGAVFLVVDRKQKIPRPSLACPQWAQPVFVLQQRNGDYLCGFCSLQNGSLILRSGLPGIPKLLRLRNRVEAEVVGKVVGMVRRLE